MRRSNSTDFAQPPSGCEAEPGPTSCAGDNPELSRRSFVRASAFGAAAVLSNHALGRARLTARIGSLLAPAPRPGWGVYRPEAPGNMASVDALAKRVGTGPPLLLWYEAWTSPWATPSQLARQCRLAASAGCVPMLTWMTMDQTSSAAPAGLANAEVAQGSKDAYLTACAQALAELRAPVYLRFNHEMNGVWSPWAAGRNTAAGVVNTAESYVAMWRHVRGIFDAAGAGQVRWVWSPNIVYSGSPSLAHLYPGDDVVDVLGMDGYNDRAHSWRGPLTLFEETYGQLLAISSTKPVFIAETGCVPTGTKAGETSAAWIREFPAALRQMRRIENVTWFDAQGYTLSVEDTNALRLVFG